MSGNPIPGGTLAEVTRHVASVLADAGLSDAPSEARWLVRAALGLTAAELVSRSEEALDTKLTDRVAACLARRARHEPLSRIAGEREFYGRVFEVSAATLDPRPDTETLIEAAIGLLDDEARKRPLRILDIGTGTGCILLTLLAEMPNASGVGTDVSDDALQVARRNAARLGLEARVRFAQTDLADGIEGPFDVLVSNPPYIRTADLDNLAPEVRDFDPHLALDGGSDGLEFYRRIAAEITRLVPAGLVVLEVGYDQAAEVSGIVQSSLPSGALEDLQVFQDVAGITRVVAARTRTNR